MEGNMVLKHRHLLNVFDYIPQGEVVLGWAWRRGLEVGLCLLDGYGDLLAVHGLRGEGHWHRCRAGILLGHKFLALVDGLFPGVLWFESMGSVFLREVLLLLLDEIIVEVVDGGAARGERTLIVRRRGSW